MRVDKLDNAISRVKCVVNTCRYYGKGNYCHASEIEIQPPDARDTQQTDCATFTPKR